MRRLFLVALAAVFFAPLAGLLSQFTWSGFAETVKDPLFVKSLKVTVIAGAVAAAVSVTLALYFGRQFALLAWRGKKAMRLVLLFPYLAPNFILAMAFVTAWNPTTGLLNSVLPFPFGLYGLAGMTFLFAIAHQPIAFLMLEEKIRRIDPALVEAAHLSGAGGFRTFLKIEFPLLMPAVATSLSLCFALNISAFAIPAWIAAPARIYPLTYRIYQSIQLGGADGIADASFHAVALLLLALIPFGAGYFVQRNEKKFVLLSGKGGRRQSREGGPSQFAVFQILFWICQIVFWIAPLTCLFLSTLVAPGCLQSRGLSCFHDISFSHYKYVLFDLEETRAAARGSLLYGGLSALMIVVFSMLALVFLGKRKKLLAFAESIFAAPLATPGAIIALGLIVVAGGRFGLNLYNTPWIVVAAFVLKHMGLSFAPLRTGLMNVSSSLLEAAQVSGAPSRKVWTKIVFPILQPEVLGGFFLVFIPILGELTMSVFLSSPSFRSFGTVLFDLQDYADQASASSLALLLIVLILLFNELARLLSRGRLGY